MSFLADRKNLIEERERTMSTSEGREKIVRDSEISKELCKPENRLKAMQIFELLTVREVKNAKARLDAIEAGFRTLQEANIAADARNEDVDRQLEKLKKKQDEFQLVLSEVDSTTQNFKESLTSLRDKFSDEVIRRSAKDVRLDKEIEILHKQLWKHSMNLSAIEEAMEDFHSRAPGFAEIRELNNTVTRLEANVRTLEAKFNGGAALAVSQKSASEERTDNQVVPRQSHGPKQGRRLEFVDKLSEAAPSETFPDSPRQMMGDESNRGNEEQLASSIPLGPQAPQPPEKAVVLLNKYDHFCNAYINKTPSSDPRFIRSYLKRIDRVSSWFIQKLLLEVHPNLVHIIEAAEIDQKTGSAIFVSTDKLAWSHIKGIMRGMDGLKLFSLLAAEQVDIEIPTPPDRGILQMELGNLNASPIVKSEQMELDGPKPASTFKSEQAEAKVPETQPRAFDLRPNRRRTGYKD
ncbi:hypothetical protein GGR53DRAFT_462499 [Hypoxylon sp. FL1150]|nr:hypothetical protein GGR53DRAFT_462499 [Hypoxylon sp. FL1150]